MRIILCTAAIAALSVMGPSARAGDLEVTVTSIRSDAGKVMAVLHPEDAAETFPGEGGAIAAQWARAGTGERRFVFADLPAGRFAVAIIHDENDNGELDRNFVGIPTEGYGFSQDAAANFGPPSFDKAAVEVPAGSDRAGTTIHLGYR